MTSRASIWIPTNEHELNSIEYLLGLAPDNDQGEITASRLRELIQHFASVDHHRGLRLNEAFKDAADALGVANQAKTSAASASSAAAANAAARASGTKYGMVKLSNSITAGLTTGWAASQQAVKSVNDRRETFESKFAGGMVTLIAPPTSGTNKGNRWLSQDHTISFGKTFAKVPHVVATTSWSSASSTQRKINVTIMDKTTTGCRMLGLWVDHGADPPASGVWHCRVDWIAVAI